MSTQPPPSANTAQTDASVDDAWRPVLVRQVEMLGRIAEAGFDMVMALRRQALAALDEPAEGENLGAAPAVDIQDAGLAFARVSRAVRMTLALQAKVIEDIRALDRGVAPQAAASPAPSPADVRRARVRGVVERAILAEHGAGREFEQMSRFAERLLEDEDLCDDVLSRPMSELVDMICRDLGLSPDWTRLAEETWALRELESGAVGAPLKDPEARAAAKSPPKLVVAWADRDPEYASP